MSLPSVNVITPHAPARDLEHIRGLIAAQTYAGPLVHTVVYDGRPFDGAQPHDILLPEQHYDRGTFAVNHAVGLSTADFCLQIADDDWIDPTAVEKLVGCWLRQPEADLIHPHMKCFADNGGDQGCVTGDPPRQNNLSSGLFRPRLFQVADMAHGPSGAYPQPGADGLMVYDWLASGARMVVLPEVLMRHYGG